MPAGSARGESMVATARPNRLIQRGLGLGRGLDMGLEMDPAPPLTPALALRSLRVALGFDFSFDLGFIVLWGAESLAGV